MKAIVYHGPRDFRVDNVPDPKVEASTDAVARIERTAICGSDLHFYHGDPLLVSGFPIHPGGQAEGARVPFADANLLPIPPEFDDEQVLFRAAWPTGCAATRSSTRTRRTFSRSSSKPDHCLPNGT